MLIFLVKQAQNILDVLVSSLLYLVLKLLYTGLIFEVNVISLLKFFSGIRDYIISKSVCVCGATNVLADDLLPNKTLRDAINRILESGNSSTENAGSTFQAQGY